MKKFILAGFLYVHIIPGFAYNLILTAHDSSFYAEKDPAQAQAGELTGVSDIYYHYDPVNQTLKVTQTEWLGDGNGGEYAAPYKSTVNYTGVTFDNMCQVVGYCDDTFQSKIYEMRTEYEAYIRNSTGNKYTKAANDYTDEKINVLEKKLSADIASASTMSAIEVSNVGQGEVSVGGGYGYYNSRSAVAFGAALGVTNNWSVNAAVGLADTNVSLRAGTNYKFKLF